jgi:hypothetical protein
VASGLLPELIVMPKLHFRNVDLDLLFADEPKLLLRELVRKVSVLYSGEDPRGHLVVLELSGFPRNPEKALRKWIKLLSTLSPKAKREFLKATSRTFDLGFDVGNDKKAVQVKLPSDLLSELAGWGASYTITLYQEEAGLEIRSATECAKP